MKIRDMVKEDYNFIWDLVKDEGYDFEKNELVDQLDSSLAVKTFDQAEIGFAAMWSIGSTLGVSNYQIIIYISPAYRLRGYGSKVLNEVVSCVSKEEPREFRIENMLTFYDVKPFLKKNDFEVWYSSSLMVFGGKHFEPIDLELTAYENHYFDQYLHLLHEAFFQMQVDNDIKPYKAEGTQTFKDYLMSVKDGLELLMDDQKLIGIIHVTEDHVTRVMVDHDYSGKGIGSKLIKYAVNKIIDSGLVPKLYIMDTNKGARTLYEGLGFKIESTVHVYRNRRNEVHSDL